MIVLLQRLLAVLLFAIVAGVPTLVESAILGPEPRQPEVRDAIAPADAAMFLAESEAAAPVAAPQEQPPAAPSRWAASSFSGTGDFFNRRGYWLADWPSGRVTRVDRGPVPRQSGLVPILMYHHVKPINFATSDSFTADLTVAPTEFEKQLAYLKERGFQSMSVEDLSLYFQGRKDLPAKPVILTFDDGYKDNYEYAYPLLKKYGFTGTFFIITGLANQGDYMSWPQIREMSLAGMEIGSHSTTHPDLARITAAERDKQLAESKKMLEDVTGLTVRTLCYPSGSYSPETITAAKKAGYVIALTTQYGATHDRSKVMELSRVRIHGTDAISTFRWRIEQYFPPGGPSAS